MRVAAGLAGGVLVTLGVLLALVSVPSPAAAHATLLASTPEDGDVLDALPDRVSLEFTEDVAQPAYVIVRAPDGAAVTEGDPEVRGALVTQMLAGADLTGTYAIAYRVVAEDGHPLTGEVRFSVGTPTGGPSGSVSASSAPRDEVATTTTAEPDPETSTRRIDVAVPAGLFAVALVLLAWSRRKET